MDTFDRVMALLPHALAPDGTIVGEGLSEIRLRAGRPVQLRGAGWEWISEGCLPPDALGAIVTALMDYSVYARECELAQGFFTMGDGCRVGVCGRMIGAGRGAMASIGSICIRCAREMPGCADARLLCSGSTIGVRESRHVFGEYRLAVDDCLEGRVPEDSILLASNSVDVHGRFGPMSNQYMTVRNGNWYGVPYRCLVPLKVGTFSWPAAVFLRSPRLRARCASCRPAWRWARRRERRRLSASRPVRLRVRSTPSRS